MIIFDLDGCLADCEHRRHFVDYTKVKTSYGSQAIRYHGVNERENDPSKFHMYHQETGDKWKADYKSFNEACELDEPIEPTIKVLNQLLLLDNEIQIWSGRCESVREKTEEWLNKHIFANSEYPIVLKMRPIGDSTPDEVLKEKWLDDHIAKVGKMVDFVFDVDPNSIEMYRRRGIFVFDCLQNDKEF